MTSAVVEDVILFIFAALLFELLLLTDAVVVVGYDLIGIPSSDSETVCFCVAVSFFWLYTDGVAVAVGHVLVLRCSILLVADAVVCPFVVCLGL